MHAKKQEPDLEGMFKVVEAMILKYGRTFDVRRELVGSKASAETKAKPMVGVYGKKLVSIAGRKPQQTCVCGIIQQKHFLGVYSMPIYSHPKAFSLSPELAKMKKGKSCINLTHLTPALKKELDTLMKEGFTLYRKLGWI